MSDVPFTLDLPTLNKLMEILERDMPTRQKAIFILASLETKKGWQELYINE